MYASDAKEVKVILQTRILHIQEISILFIALNDMSSNAFLQLFQHSFFRTISVILINMTLTKDF